jgi:hypothetical protein
MFYKQKAEQSELGGFAKDMFPKMIEQLEAVQEQIAQLALCFLEL